MRRAPALAACALAAVAAGCGGGDGLVDLTIALDPSVPDTTVAALRTLTLDVTGLDTTTVSDPLAQPFAVHRQERLVVRSPAGGAVTLAITARDAASAPLLYGQVSFTLQPGAETMQLVTLAAVVPRLDGGADFAMVDSMSGDLPQPDLLPPADLASADLAPIPCPTNVLLCDGFESGAIDALRWDAINPAVGGSISLDNTRAHRGQWSLHAHLNPVTATNSGEAEIGEGHTFTAGQTFYVRAFYYFPSAAQATVSTIIDTGQSVTPYDSVSLAIDHDALSIFDSFVTPNTYNVATAPKIPLDTWTCIEYELDEGTPNHTRAWVNGVSSLDLAQSTTGTPGIAQVQIGLAMYPPNTSTIAVDAWVDDIIVDKAPIGCAR